MRESQIEGYLVKRVKALGGEVRKLQWIGRRGAPDRLVLLPKRTATKGLDCAWCNPKARVLWIELKALGEQPARHQVREHARMRAMGLDVFVIDSIDGVDAVLCQV